MRKLLLAVCFCLSLSLTASAETVLLQNGSFVTGAAHSVQVRFSGENFSMSYVGDVFSVTNFSLNTIIHGFGRISFNGISSQSFRGLISFTDELLMGTVTAYSDFFQETSPLFTVTFNAVGFVVVEHDGALRTTFTVTVPEPTPLLLLALSIVWLARLKGLQICKMLANLLKS